MFTEKAIANDFKLQEFLKHKSVSGAIQAAAISQVENWYETKSVFDEQVNQEIMLFWMMIFLMLFLLFFGAQNVES